MPILFIYVEAFYRNVVRGIWGEINNGKGCHKYVIAHCWMLHKSLKIRRLIYLPECGYEKKCGTPLTPIQRIWRIVFLVPIIHRSALRYGFQNAVQRNAKIHKESERSMNLVAICFVFSIHFRTPCLSVLGLVALLQSFIQHKLYQQSLPDKCLDL